MVAFCRQRQARTGELEGLTSMVVVVFALLGAHIHLLRALVEAMSVAYVLCCVLLRSHRVPLGHGHARFA